MKDFGVMELEAGYSERMILKKMSLQIPAGQITTIIGPNGCGKSTLLKAMGRIIKAKNGGVLLDGKNILELSTRELAKRIAILPQSPTAPDGLTVEELVSYGRYPHQKGTGKLTNEDRRIVAWALEVTGLEVLSEQVVDHLSGGQKQRVWIALALCQQTDLILLDEPTTYLDMAYQLEVLELLEALNKKHGVTIVMVLHDLNLASRYSDYLIAMRDGIVIKQGTPDEVIQREVLCHVYRIDATILMEEESKKPVCFSYHLLKVDTERKNEEEETAS